MHLRRKLVLAAIVGLALLPGRAALAAPQDDLKGVLERLNVAAANFHSTSADVESDDITTAPINEKDVFKGIVYYDRKGSSFRMGVHFNLHNGKPSGKAYTYVGGSFKIFDAGANQVTTYAKAGKWESYVMLGIGASGTELAAKWEIKVLGSESIDGVKTAVLELVAKDPDVRKNVSKVTVYIDPDRAVSLKQVFTLTDSSSKVFLYSNFKLNQSLPADAFEFKTNHQTVYSAQ